MHFYQQDLTKIKAILVIFVSKCNIYRVLGVRCPKKKENKKIRNLALEDMPE